MRLTPLALAAGLLLGGGGGGGSAMAQTPPADGTGAPEPAALEPSRRLHPAPKGEAARETPVFVRARKLSGRPDLDAHAEGDVEFRRDGTAISADRLDYDHPEDLAVARGHVRIQREGAVYAGPELQLRLQRFEGFFLEPTFEFLALGAGGKADRIDFIDSSRAVATNALYTSCTRDGSAEPDWVLKADKVQLDFDANEGRAEGAVLRFLGAPILAWPSLSFPLTDARKSGWLPPSFNFDSRSGFELAVPYYWNIAPNRDATLTPHAYTRRGLGLDGEFRYLERDLGGELKLGLLPDDKVAARSRGSLQWRHDGRFGETRYAIDLTRVSDDGWWKDFPDAGRGLTPRLLSSRAGLERPFALGGGDGLLYARTQNWQVLQGSDQLVTPPYEREPQLGAQWHGGVGHGFELALESELNRFVLPANDPASGRPSGTRWHALGALAWPLRESGWWVTPKFSFNAASYHVDQPMADGRSSASRFIPTFSVDGGLEYERHIEAFGRALRQTLEPRLLYVDTPYRQQSNLPNFDAAAKDFNFNSIYSENAFSGVDRVSDANQLSVGVTSRLVDENSGAEAMRLGVVQRILFRDQRVTPKADGSPDGDPVTQKLSDLLLLGSTSVVPNWSFDTALQYGSEISRIVRSVTSVRYSPGPFRTVNATYLLTRGVSEQLQLGWQWPIYTRSGVTTAGSGSGSGCGGNWYGVGRINYSLRDRRLTDSIFGVEYDAGCWIGRVVAERLSIGSSEATTRVQIQLELVGLSRLGSNPLQVLKDNIPGYRLLREERRQPTPSDE